MSIGDCWIQTRVAMQMLGVSRSGMWKLYKSGRLKKRWCPEPGKPFATVYYSFVEVRELAKASARAKRRLNTARAAGKTESEPTDWISTKAAAEILAVDVSRVWLLIQRGILTCRREEWGRTRVRLWLSRAVVAAYRDDAERWKDRRTYDRTQRDRPRLTCTP